jgi:hypothetical protein
MILAFQSFVYLFVDFFKENSLGLEYPTLIGHVFELFFVILAARGQLLVTLVLLLNAFAIAFSVEPQQRCIGSKCYVAYENVSVNQTAAANECWHRWRGSLASIANKLQQDTLYELLDTSDTSQSKMFWIGAQFQQLSGWQWLDGAPLSNVPPGTPKFPVKILLFGKLHKLISD